MCTSCSNGIIRLVHNFLYNFITIRVLFFVNALLRFFHFGIFALRSHFSRTDGLLTYRAVLMNKFVMFLLAAPEVVF